MTKTKKFNGDSIKDSSHLNIQSGNKSEKFLVSLVVVACKQIEHVARRTVEGSVRCFSSNGFSSMDF